jgi:hypothetical protein
MELRKQKGQWQVKSRIAVSSFDSRQLSQLPAPSSGALTSKSKSS